MSQVVILAAGRTAIGAFNGSLKSVPAAALGAAVIKGLVDKVGLKGDAVDEVILGHVLQAGTGQCTARQAALHAGLPETVPCMAINKVCGSGLKAVHLAAQAIKCGDADIVIAGGHESMSMSPHVVPNSRDGQRSKTPWHRRGSQSVTFSVLPLNQCMPRPAAGSAQGLAVLCSRFAVTVMMIQSTGARAWLSPA